MMNEFKSKIQKFGSMPNDTIYQHLLDEIADNVLCYDMRNNYFTFETSDPKTGQILMEASIMCGHSLNMDSYGHLKFLLSYGFLPLSEDKSANKVKVDLENPEVVVSLDVFGSTGLGYLDMMNESLISLNLASDTVVSVARKKADLTGPLSLLMESYSQVKHNSKLPSHWFDNKPYNLIVENKRTVSEKMDRMITESVSDEDISTNQKLFEVAMYEDSNFFEMCQKIGKNLISVVEQFALKIAENKDVKIDLSTVKYQFLNQDEIIKQFFESQYNESHPLIQNIKEQMKEKYKDQKDIKMDSIHDIMGLVINETKE